ncbi:BppU family phage baseplate upper protein [Limosilactobacillus fermentum]
MSQTLTYTIGADKRALVSDVQDFHIDFANDNSNWVQARQYERSMRQVFVNIKNEDGTPFDLTGCNVWFEGLLPKNSNGDFKIIDDNGYVALDPSAGRFRFDMPGHAFTVAGSYRQAFFRIVNNGNSVTTLEFDLEVLADKVISNLVARDYITPFEDLYAKLEDILTNADGDLKSKLATWTTQFTDLMTKLSQQGTDTSNMLANVQTTLKNLETQIASDGLLKRSDLDTLLIPLQNSLGTVTNFKTNGQTLVDKTIEEFSERSINVKWFGAIGDGVADDTLAIQQAIDYCAPFEWKGSIQETKAAMNTAKYSTLFIPSGTYRTTKPLLLAPFLTIEGQSNVGFSDKHATMIVADFTNETGAIIDTAPWNQDGERAVGVKLSHDSWDNSETTGCTSVVLRNINFSVAVGQKIGMGFNRAAAIQSVVEHCSFESGGGQLYVGIRSSCLWGGSLKENKISTTMYCLENTDDVTIDVQINNYLSILGDKPTNFSTEYPDSSMETLSACIYNRYADPHFYSNICEGGDVGMLSSYSNAIKDNNNYYEGIKKYIYVCHTVNISASPKNILSENAKLFWLSANKSYKFDFTATSYFKIAGFGSASYVELISVAGIKGFPDFNHLIHFVDVESEQQINVYVDSSNGDDANSGYSEDYPVKTLQGAIDRCIDDRTNAIHLKDGDTIVTKYNYDTGNVSNKIFNNLKLLIRSDKGSAINVGQSYNQTESLPFGVSKVVFENVTLNLPEKVSDAYRPFVKTKGQQIEVVLNGCVVNNGILAGTVWGEGGLVNINFNNTTTNNMQLLDDAGSVGSVAWTELSQSSTFNGSKLGIDGKGCIYSKDFSS